MSFANDRRLLRTIQLACLAAALATIAACKGPDPSTFSCSSSAECPGDYHCDLGTASTAGSFKCVSGAPAPRTITADATKFLLSKRPSADGSVRTTILANLGAVTSAPDFVGVRLIASQAGHDLADSPVAADGSVLEFQLPQATAQVSLRVQDDSGHSVAVTGYPEQVELSFAGREIAGTTNPAAIYDVSTTSDSTFAPATWITNGPGADGGVPTQFAQNDTLFPDGGVQFANSYSSIGYLDFHQAVSGGVSAPADAPVGGAGGPPVGWQPYSALATADSATPPPVARVGAGLIQQSAPFGTGFFLYGGADLAGAPIDVPGQVYSFNPSAGWAITPVTAGATLPSTGVRSGAAFGGFGFQSCTGPCTQLNYSFTMIGGLVPGAAPAPSNGIVAFGTQTDISAAGAVTATRTGWFDVPAVMPLRNAGMSSTPALILVGTAANLNPGNLFSGTMMVGGQGVTQGAVHDNSGCLLFAGLPGFFTSSNTPAANSFFSCTDGNWATAAGATGAPSIGFRTGMTLVGTSDFTGNPTTFYVFGGRRAGGPAGTDGLKNDLWKGVLTCPASTAVPPAPCKPQVAWSLVSPATPAGAPAARSGAGAASWAGIGNGRFLLFGGTNAANQVLADAWEFDPNPAVGPVWRPVTAEAAAIVPAARSQFAMMGDGVRAFLLGGNLNGAATDQVWFSARESVGRILAKFPFSLPAVDQATSVKITVDAANMSNTGAFIWDGSLWRAFGFTVFEGGASHLLKSPTASGTGFLQPDGNIYLLLMQGSRPTPGSTFQPTVSVDRLKVTVDFK